MSNILSVREACEADIPAIHALLEIYAKKQIVLARDENDIRFYLGNFVVGTIDGAIRGCVAVRDFGSDLLEVRSLAVEPEFHGKGVGRAMVESIIAGLKVRRDHFRLFALTYQEGFFSKLGFRRVTREQFPEKIWADCLRCPKHDRCDEIAMLFP